MPRRNGAAPQDAAGTVDVLMITFNRPDYTLASLERLLATCDEQTRVWVWQNGNDPRTCEVVRSFHGHPRLGPVHMHPINAGLVEPTNWLFRESHAPFVAKVDDDCLVEDGWAERLRAVLEHNERVGVAACWHFQPEDFDETLCKDKIIDLSGNQRLLRNRWVQGSGIMIRRACIDQLGLVPPDDRGITPYLARIHEQGWQVGWVLPLIGLDHMDDPRSAHSRFRTEEDFRRNRPLSADFGDVHTLAEWKERIRWNARVVQSEPLLTGRKAAFHRWTKRAQERVFAILGRQPEWRTRARHQAASLRDQQSR